jgi:beta-propeller uncharacterized protein DUF5122
MRVRATVLRGIAAGGIAVIMAATGMGTASASPAVPLVSTNPVNYTPNITNGAAYKSAEANGMLYVGGSFTSVTAAAGTTPTGTFTRNHILAFNAATGSISTSFAPNVNGDVWAIVPSGTSLYIGGSFSSVNGVARRGLAKIDATTGAVDTSFNAALTSGNVTEAALVSGRLIISGTFPKKILAVNPASGANTGYINVAVTGSVASNAGPVEVYRFAVNPAGTKLVGVGNFTTVGGATHYRAFMLDLGSTAASVSAWRYTPLQQMCAASSLPDYMRDVDFSPDGSYFVFVSTGFVPLSGQVGIALCDAASRFETANLSPARPTWINYTGGDTLHSVAVTDQAVYVQGHQRWLNNPQGRDNAGPGAVSRPGIGAIDPTTGLALAWNPTKDRGVGGKDLLVTARGLWVASDTAHIGHETHMRIALLP